MTVFCGKKNLAQGADRCERLSSFSGPSALRKQSASHHSSVITRLSNRQGQGRATVRGETLVANKKMIEEVATLQSLLLKCNNYTCIGKNLKKFISKVAMWFT